MDRRTLCVVRCIRCGSEYHYRGDGLGELAAKKWFFEHKPWECTRKAVEVAA